MLRIKKISDAIFPRDFSEAINSVDVPSKKEERIQEKQIKEIEKHYEKQLEKLQHIIEITKDSPKLIKLKNLYEENPYSFAEQYNISYKLSSSEIKSIKSSISTKLLKSKEERKKIESIIREKELLNIERKYTEKYEQIIKKYPPKTIYKYEDTDESTFFKTKYEGNYKLYAKDFNLPFIPLEEMPFSHYSFIYNNNSFYKEESKPILENEKIYSIKSFNEYHLMELNIDSLENVDRQVIMYTPVFEHLAFFLYKNCLYQAEFNEVFSEDELLLLVKEKLYKDDKKFTQLKKQIELYETSEIANTAKRSREPLSEEVKFEVWRRDQGRCEICGSQENLEFDHIIPFSKGGSSTARNIQLLCQNCNRHKSDKI